MNSSERHARIKELFDVACDLSPEKRIVYLDEQCGEDRELRGEVESLLAFEDADEGALAGDHRGAGPELLAEELASSENAASGQPDTIDKYKIIRQIGQGGMGIVYEAEQDHPRRRVALKVIRTAFASTDLYKRFRAEAQLLGQLDHPGIAHIYEAGTAQIGDRDCPFFAMEYIDGNPLDRHVRKARLTHREILELMALVCDAVFHAHQSGVIHRDLKPANILIKRERTGQGQGNTSPTLGTSRLGQPKILDFGIARATDSDLQVTTIHTHVGQIVGTLAYMSPEQVAGRESVDVRSDVYALGVILYELLSGDRPFELAGKPMAEAARIIDEEEPTDLATRNTELRGDISTIVSKAMDKEPDRRYRSAAELGDDIRRYLRSEPITARPTSAAYQLQKFARRNRALVAGVLATIVALAVGLVVSTAGFLSARAERDAKIEALELSDAVTVFLSDMLAAANPAEQGREVTVREVLDNAATAIGSDFADRPAVEAELRVIMCQTYVALGEYARADTQVTEAIEIIESGRLADTRGFTGIYGLLGQAKYFQGQYPEALEAFTADLEITRGYEPRDDAGVLSALSNVAYLNMQGGKYGVAKSLFAEAVELASEALGPDDPMALDLKGNVAMLDHRMELYDVAEAGYLDVIERSRRVRGDEHPQTLLFLSNLASTYMGAEKFAEAEPVLREALEVQERVIGPAHSQTFITLGNLAQTLSHLGRDTEAIELVEEGIARSKEAYGPQARSTLYMEAASGRILFDAGEYDRALDVFNRVLAIAKAEVGADSELAYDVWIDLINLHTTQRDAQAHLGTATDIVESLTEPLGESHERVVTARIEMGRAYRSLERFEESETQLLAVYEIGEGPPRETAASELAKLYDAWGQPEKAAEWRNRQDEG